MTNILLIIVSLVMVAVLIIIIIIIIRNKHTVTGRFGIFSGILPLTYGYRTYDNHCEFEIELLRDFGNKLKVKIVSTLNYRLGVLNNEYYKANFNKKYKKGRKIIVDKPDVSWVKNSPSEKTTFVIKNAQLSELVKTGEVTVDGIDLKLEDGWDYKKALSVVIESTN